MFTAAFIAAVGIFLLTVLNLALPWAAWRARRLSMQATDSVERYKRLCDYYFMVTALGIADFIIALYVLFGAWGLFGLSSIIPAIAFMRWLMRKNKEV